MSLPKTMTPSLVKKLNVACNTFKQVCDESCDKLGWCDACWIAAGGGAQETGSSVGRTQAIPGVDGSNPS